MGVFALSAGFSRGRFGDFTRSLLASVPGGDLKSKLGSVRASATSASSSRRELLPISSHDARPYFSGLPCSKVSPRMRPLGVLWSGLVLDALNFLACAGWSSSPTRSSAPPGLDPAQKCCLDHIWHAVQHFVEFDGAPFHLETCMEDLLHKKLGYQGEVGSKRRELTRVLPCAPLLAAGQWPSRTPVSRVHASSSEWYSLARAGFERGLFEPIAETGIFRDAWGTPVLNGAMGVDKPKLVDGEVVTCLRFTCIFCSINAFFRKLRGDAGDLPYLGQLGLVLLEGYEILTIDSEDMQACFNLFRMPPAWSAFFAFEKVVPMSAFGGDPSVMTHVAMRAVPMGWLGAVDLMQCMARRFVFGLCGVSANTELSKEQEVPSGDISVVCMDGFDFVRRLRVLSGKLDELQFEASEEHGRFVQTCSELGLPLNAAKSLVEGLAGQILGGELDGVRGTLAVERGKGHALISKALALLTRRAWPAAGLQHWIGGYCFAAGFRRPTFSVLQECFGFAAAAETKAQGILEPDPQVVDEVMVATALLPMCFTDLRAQLRRIISSSDASESGGGASEARQLISAFDPETAEVHDDVNAALNEEVGSCSMTAWILGDASLKIGAAACHGPPSGSTLNSGAGAKPQRLPQERTRERRPCFVIHSASSWIWHQAPLAEVLELEGVISTWTCTCRYGAQFGTPMRIAHNSPALDVLCGSGPCDCPIEGRGRLDVELPVKFAEVFGHWASEIASLGGCAFLPVAPSERPAWLAEGLWVATARLRQEALQPAIVEKLLETMSTMRRGAEIEHLKAMLKRADYRGSDVRLTTGALVDGCRQDVPYPAFCWEWTTAQSYGWKAPQHINALESTAFFNYVRSQAGSKDFHKRRFCHIFDSRVVSCVVAKGWSSSRLLNRLCRRFAAFSIASNTYVLTFWTVSAWNHSDAASRRLRETLGELDEEVGEYINHLYLDSYPQGWAIDLVSAMKRYYPKCRKKLNIASLYLKNWARVTERRRAIPASRDLVIGMAVAALFERKVRLAFGILLSFVGLLRVGEIIGATGRQLAVFGGGSLLTLALPDSKGAKRTGDTEQVTVYDPLVLKLAAIITSNTEPNEKILQLTYAEFAKELTRLGRMFGVRSPRFTPYCLRRGGATWHFTKYSSYDATVDLGRWAQVRTAKLYIDQATAETTELLLPSWGLRRLELAVKIIDELVTQT
ncbi:unnamed protein product, partial [Prorocentrum cordatum]